jgi:hypothetical protein
MVLNLKQTGTFILRVAVLGVGLLLFLSSSTQAQIKLCIEAVGFWGCNQFQSCAWAQAQQPTLTQGTIDQYCGRAGGTVTTVAKGSGGRCGWYVLDVTCNSSGSTSPVGQPSQSHHVTGRHFCVDESRTGVGRDAGTCDVTSYGGSCQEACVNARTNLGNGDPCTRCNGILDASRRRSRTEWIQGGACTNIKC